MTLEYECEQLGTIPMFRNVDMKSRKIVAMSSERLEFQPGETMFQEGDPSDSIYFLINGKVSVQRGVDDHAIEVAQITKGQLLGEIGVLCDIPRTASIVALEPTIALRTDAKLFNELLLHIPEVAVSLARGLAEQVSKTTDRLVASAEAENS